MNKQELVKDLNPEIIFYHKELNKADITSLSIYETTPSVQNEKV